MQYSYPKGERMLRLRDPEEFTRSSGPLPLRLGASYFIANIF
jgi:hypothetical protein